MSFLNSIFLLALPLAAAPLVLHLLRRKQRQVISWGAMQFLTDAVGEGRRFDRLEEWLLLAMRVAAILAFVLALARPLVRGLTPRPATSTEVVVVIDDSLSTARESGDGKIYDAIRDNIRSFLEDRSASENVRLMLAAEGPRWLVETPIQATAGGKRELNKALESSRPTGGAANFLSCLRLASSLTSTGANAPRRVVVFTDGQSKGWQIGSSAAWERLRAAINQGPRKVSFEVVSMEAPVPAKANLSLKRVTASRQIVAEKESVTLTAEVINTGKSDSSTTVIDWSIDGKSKGQSALSIVAAGQTRSVEFTAPMESKGVFDVVASIKASDPIELDNQAGVVVEVLEAVPILVLAGTTDLEAAENAFLATALGYDKTENTQDVDRWRSLFRPTFVSLENANKENFENYHTVAISGLNDGLSPATIEKLEEYVRDGGGLWLMLGARIEKDEFNRRWYREGAGLCPLPLASLLRPEDRDSAEASIHPPTADHPTTMMLADTNRLDIDRVRFRRYYTFRRQAGQDLTPLLESGRGSPLAMLHFLGKGRVIVQGYPLQMDWSDLAISKSFVVLVQDWLTYLTQPAATRFNLVAREPFVYPVDASHEDAKAEVKVPDGSTVDLKPADRGGSVAYRFAQTSLPGRYELKLPASAGGKPLPFWVARDPEESDLTPLEPRDMTMLTQTAGIQFGKVTPSADTVKFAQAQLEPAWSPLLFAMVCLMVAESLLATRVSRGRFGGAVAG